MTLRRNSFRERLYQAARFAVGYDTRTCNELVNAVIEEWAAGLARDGHFVAAGFGSFWVRSDRGRTGRVEGTDEMVRILPRCDVDFRPSGALEALVEAAPPTPRRQRP